MTLVPKPKSFQGGNALEDLFRRSVRLATVVQATSRRRDVRELRSKIVLLLLALRCPMFGTPAKGWYVKGAVARRGLEGLLRSWAGFWGELAPSLRTLQAHASVLERSCAIVRAPGDWIPTAAGAPRLRFPDTIHVLDDERDAAWWADEGLPLLERAPHARIDPTAWRKLFRGWRDRARDPQARLPFPPAKLRPDQDQRPAAQGPEDAAVVRAVLDRGRPDLGELLSALREIGAAPDGRVQFQLAADAPALVRAAARLATELANRTRIRNRPGWLVWAFREAGGKVSRGQLGGRLGA